MTTKTKNQFTIKCANYGCRYNVRFYCEQCGIGICGRNGHHEKDSIGGYHTLIPIDKFTDAQKADMATYWD